MDTEILIPLLLPRLFFDPVPESVPKFLEDDPELKESWKLNSTASSLKGIISEGTVIESVSSL